MQIDIVNGFGYLFGGCSILFQRTHPTSVVQAHLVMEQYHLRNVGAAVHFQNVGVTEAERLFQCHPALCAETGNHGSGNNKMVFDIIQRVGGQLSHPLRAFKPAPAAIVLHQTNLSCRYRTVKEVLLTGVAMGRGDAVHIQIHRFPLVSLLHVVRPPFT